MNIWSVLFQNQNVIWINMLSYVKLKLKTKLSGTRQKHRISRYAKEFVKKIIGICITMPYWPDTFQVKMIIFRFVSTHCLFWDFAFLTKYHLTTICKPHMSNKLEIRTYLWLDDLRAIDWAVHDRQLAACIQCDIRLETDPINCMVFLNCCTLKLVYLEDAEAY